MYKHSVTLTANTIAVMETRAGVVMAINSATVQAALIIDHSSPLNLRSGGHIMVAK